MQRAFRCSLHFFALLSSKLPLQAVRPGQKGAPQAAPVCRACTLDAKTTSSSTGKPIQAVAVKKLA